MSSRSSSEELRVVAPLTAEQRKILSPEALAFVGRLMRRFGPRREELLRQRVERQRVLDSGMSLDFRIFAPKLARSGNPNGPWRRSPATSPTAGSRSRDRSIAR